MFKLVINLADTFMCLKTTISGKNSTVCTKCVEYTNIYQRGWVGALWAVPCERK